MGARRHRVALIHSLLLVAAAPAAAQMRAADLVGPLLSTTPGAAAPVQAPPGPHFRMVARELRWPGEPRRNGLIAAYPLDDNIQIGVGRFSVAEIARPRTNVEAERHPMAVRPKEGRIAAVGLSFSF